MELDTFARATQRQFFSAINSSPLEEDSVVGVVGDDTEEGEEERLAAGEQDDMRVMKEAQKSWSEDNYYGGSNITALVQLDEFEREDDALVITMNNIHKTYLLGVEGVPALRGVSMSVRRGEFLIIYGTSGGQHAFLFHHERGARAGLAQEADQVLFSFMHVRFFPRWQDIAPQYHGHDRQTHQGQHAHLLHTYRRTYSFFPLCFLVSLLSLFSVSFS